ncbi:SdiA-regulated domain-containing protein [Desulfofustis glycolicus]|nr:SdiA-regulated domain-containing protein [Desulfofustis glycolicus]MCB2216093.1 SdiA-regulated domain-containing protein [Desulfobulbaceae bacterium]
MNKWAVIAIAKQCLIGTVVALVLLACQSVCAASDPDRVVELAPDIVEPSDICLHPDGESLLIVSDKGTLFQTDANGTVLTRAPFQGGDFEGVYSHAGKIYVADESNRLVHRFNPDGLVLEQTFSIPYDGKRNSGYESIVYNPVREVFLLITEKDPVTILELDDSFQVRAALPFAAASDISAATWHDGALWLLSDEEQAVLKLDPDRYEVLERWNISAVKKPEGIVFIGGSMLVVCDKEQLLYFFPAPWEKR